MQCTKLESSDTLFISVMCNFHDKIREIYFYASMEEAEDKFGKKGTARAGLTLGIIGTALAALGNNNGCGCGGNGILGGLFGGNNNGCAMQAAEQAKTLAMAQGQTKES